MALQVGDKATIKTGSEKDPAHVGASVTIIRVQYCVQFENKTACWYGSDELVPPPAPKPAAAPVKVAAPPAAKVVPQAASAVPETDAGDTKKE